MSKKGTHHQPHIGIFGSTNRGKSSLINALLKQDFAIVSEIAGTTTDPVRKTMELFGVGPIVLIDTAGINDNTLLGKQRTKKTTEMMDQVDLALVMIEQNTVNREEEKLLEAFIVHKIPFIIIHGKDDLCQLNSSFAASIQEKYRVNILPFSIKNTAQVEAIETCLVEEIPENSYQTTNLVKTIVKPNDLILLVTPIDSEAPEGRLILPQVQCIRSILDEHVACLILQDSELDYYLNTKKIIPNLIITDSQVFGKVNKIIPSSIPLTSFSILLAHHKGDFELYLKGTPQLDHLQEGDRVLILESCTHQVSCDDIGRVKLPNWINNFTNKKLNYDIVSGLSHPERAFTDYALIIQCGACMITQNQLRKRLRKASFAGVPITNYGMAIAYIHGIYNRVIAPFIH